MAKRYRVTCLEMGISAIYWNDENGFFHQQGSNDTEREGHICYESKYTAEGNATRDYNELINDGYNATIEEI